MQLIQQTEANIARLPRALVVRGIVAIAFGVIILLWPGLTLAALVLIIAVFATVDGVASLVLAFSGLPVASQLWLVINGIAGVAVGVITFASPGITELALLYVIGAWAIILGGIQILAAFSAPIETRFRVVLFFYGIIAVAFGLIMFARPGTGALAVVTLIAAFAIITGVTLIAAAFQFHSEAMDLKSRIYSIAQGRV